jgi:hypothetical protein
MKASPSQGVHGLHRRGGFIAFSAEPDGQFG